MANMSFGVHNGSINLSDLILNEQMVIKEISLDDFERIQTKNPNIIYRIQGTDLFYLGSLLLPNPTIDGSAQRYLLSGMDENGMYYIHVYDGIRLVPIAAFKDPNDAVRVLNTYSMIGSDEMDRAITQLIIQYIDRNLSAHNLLMGFLTLHKWNSHPLFQSLNSKVIELTPPGHHDAPVIPGVVIRWLGELDLTNAKLRIYRIYKDLCNVFEKHRIADHRSKAFHGAQLHVVIEGVEWKHLLTDIRAVFR